MLTFVYFGLETREGQRTFKHEKDFDDVYLMLGLYADHLFGQAQLGYNLLCKALRKHKLITGDSLMTDYQSPVSSSLVTLKEREQHSRRQWSSYQLNS